MLDDGEGSDTLERSTVKATLGEVREKLRVRNCGRDGEVSRTSRLSA